MSIENNVEETKKPSIPADKESFQNPNVDPVPYCEREEWSVDYGNGTE